MIYVQMGIALLGVFIVLRGRYGFGRKEVTSPVAPLVGCLLAGQLVLAVGISVICSVSSAYPGGGRTIRDSNGFSVPVLEMREKVEKPDWVNPLLTVTAVLLAGVLTVVGLREENDDLQLEGPLPEGTDRQGYAPSAQALRALPPERPPTASLLPPEVRRYRGTAEALPPEILALGEADRLHRPWPVLTLLRKNPTGAVGLGTVLFLGPVLLAVVAKTSFAMVLALLPIVLLGVALLTVPWLPLQRLPSYVVFPDALVIVEEDDFTVLPWQVIQEFPSANSLRTTDDQSFQLAATVQEPGRLMRTVRERVAQLLVPSALETLESGAPLTFGPFTVSSYTITWSGRTLPWSQVSRLYLRKTRQRRILTIHEVGKSAAWCSEDVSTIPNEFVFLKVIWQACPSHLMPSGVV